MMYPKDGIFIQSKVMIKALQILKLKLTKRERWHPQIKTKQNITSNLFINHYMELYTPNRVLPLGFSFYNTNRDIDGDRMGGLRFIWYHYCEILQNSIEL